jgi:predicted nucleic acid-binding protein
MMAYLDSCILIYRLEGAPPFRTPVVEAMNAAASAVFCMSDLVRLDCLVDPIRAADTSRKVAFEAQLRKLRGLRLTRTVFELAAELRARHRLRTPDAIHSATAIHHGCDEFWTNDRRLAAIEDRITIRVLP